MRATQLPNLYLVTDQIKGRSVFTASEISKDSTIEICPVIVLPKRDTLKIHETLLHDYYFLWNNEYESAIALGFGSLYNHSSQPNAEIELVYGDNEIHIIAAQTIEAGVEITIDYMAGKNKEFKLWFNPV